MAWTQADIDALKNAIKSGVRRVGYSDRTIEYQSVADMLSILAAMEADAAGSAATEGRSTFAAPRRD